MSDTMNRRHFLAAGTVAGLTLTGSAAAQDNQDSRQQLSVGIMGTGGRGKGLARTFQQQTGVTVSYVCDVDQRQAEQAAGIVAKANNNRAPRVVTDFRRVLDDKSVDVVVIAAPNHWHAPAAILACAANKHVYVEKPCSGTPREGELLVQAARKYKRDVQMGNQRRSWPKIIEAMSELRKGIIGRVYLAQSWYFNNRPSIGRGKEAEVPQGLDYDLWQGPAPRRPYRTNYLPYNWHWFWHWGNGELGNNGIHMIDLCRWGLGVDFPVRVTSSGGRYRYQDDQETPDTHIVSFEFEDRKAISWEGFSCSRIPGITVKEKSAVPGRPEVLFHGENGTLALSDREKGYIVFDTAGKEVRRVTGTAKEGSDDLHLSNFLNAIRTGGNLNSEIELGAKSTLLCHLGNIAHRTGRSLRCDPRNGHILDDKAAMAYWTREYEKGWEPRVG